MTRLAVVAGALVALGCASSGGRIPEPPAGTTAVGPEVALRFYQRAETFYQRLIRRRVNTIETFRDPVLREHFETQDGFFDYYADLSRALGEAHFEKSRPSSVEVQEFVFESPTRAWVQVRFVGSDRRPLRPNRVELIRRDRWERSEQTWWIQPGRL